MAARPPLLPASLQKELGTVDVRRPNGWYGDLYESTPELRFPWNMDVYDRMRRQDAQIRSLLRATILPIMGTSWRLAGTSVREAVMKMVTAELGLVEDDQGRLRSREGGVSWDKILRHIMLHLPMGFAPLCRWYTLGKPDFPGLPKEVAHLNLSPRMPRTIWGFQEDENTQELRGIWQNTITGNYGGLSGGPSMYGPYGYTGNVIVESADIKSASPDRVLIDKDHLVMFINEQEGTNWSGESILRSTYKHWLIKDALLRIGALSVDRQGMGVPVITYPKDEAGAKTTALELASQVRAGEDSGLALPEGWTLSLLGVEGNVQDALKWVNYHDQAQSRSMLAMFLDLGHSQGLGSGQTADAFVDYFLLAEKAVIRYIEEVVTEEIIRPLVRVNFGPDEPYPTLIGDDPRSEAEPTAQAIGILTNAGIIHPDEAVRSDIRRRFGLPQEPEREDGDESVGADQTNMPVGATGRHANELDRITMSAYHLIKSGFDADAVMQYLGLQSLPMTPTPAAPGAAPAADPAVQDPTADPAEGLLPADLQPAAKPAAPAPAAPAPAPAAPAPPAAPPAEPGEKPVKVAPHTRGGVPMPSYTRRKPAARTASAGVDRKGIELHVGDAVMVALAGGIDAGLVFDGSKAQLAVSVDDDDTLLELVDRNKVQLLAAADSEHAVPAVVKANIRKGMAEADDGKTVPAITRKLLAGTITTAEAVALAAWFDKRHRKLESTGDERKMTHVDGSLTKHGVNVLLRGGTACESWVKSIGHGSAAMSSISFDTETDRIRENRKKPKARRRHEFAPAVWTNPGGHPRCLLCGVEEPVGGMCDGADNDGMQETQPGAKNPITPAATPPPATAASALAGTGTMVALFPHPDDAQQMALSGEDAEDPNDLHVTLAYLPDFPAEKLPELHHAVARFASRTPPIDASVSGKGQFNDDGDGNPVTYASIDGPNLAEHRTQLVQQLRGAGHNIASNHGFDPHMTLAYSKRDEDVPSRPLRFDHVTVASGDRRTHFPLAGLPMTDDGTEKAVSAFASGDTDMTELANRAASLIERLQALSAG